jgi:methyl-accepting chemotaxis protein
MFDTLAKGASFINRRYQYRFIAQFCGSVLIGAAIFMTLFYLFTYMELDGTYYNSLTTLQGLRDNILLAMAVTTGTVLIVVTLAVLAITRIGSHRIAGPIYRLERTLESVGSGDLGLRIRFRRHDAVEGMAEEINSAVEGLGARISDLHRDVKGIREEAERLKADPSRSPAILLEKMRLLKKTVSEFKTE